VEFDVHQEWKKVLARDKEQTPRENC